MTIAEYFECSILQTEDTLFDSYRKNSRDCISASKMIISPDEWETREQACRDAEFSRLTLCCTHDALYTKHRILERRYTELVLVDLVISLGLISLGSSLTIFRKSKFVMKVRDTMIGILKQLLFSEHLFGY